MSASDIITVADDLEPEQPAPLGEPSSFPGEPPRAPGRPKGSRTDPRKLSAAAKLQGKAAPRAGRPSTSARTDAELTRQLAGGYELTGSMLQALTALGGKLPPAAAEMAGRLALIGRAMVRNADECAASVVAYSNKSPRLRAWLERSGQGASLLGIVLAHLPLVVAAFAEAPEQLVPAAEPTDATGLGGLFAGMTPDDTAVLADLAASVFGGGLFPGMTVPATATEPEPAEEL